MPPDNGPDPVYIIQPIYVPGPVIIADYYQDDYYEEPTYYDSEPDYSGEDLSLAFTAGTMVLNYVFIRSGQTNEFAAGTGFVFGVASIAIASRSSSKHAFLDYLAGVAAIGFSVWNLSGGMSQNDAYGETDTYDPYPYSTNVTAGQTVGWSFSF
ncbi:MAG: hypothetical protein PVF33_11540 [Candidatus Latescibacterota bacterium]